MLYREFQPSADLAGYIQVIWAMESESEEEIYPRSQIMPDGIVEVIFHYGDPFYSVRGEEKTLQSRCFAVSMMKNFIELESNGKTGFIAARFLPWGAYHFFKEPVQHFIDGEMDAEKLWPGKVKAVLAELKKTGPLDYKIAVVEKFFRARLEEHKQADSNLDNAIKLIREQKGNLSIEEVCERTGYNTKQLERKFLLLVGTTPKTFSRVCRFLNICNHLEEYQNTSLAKLSYDCGYYDQAHFIKEFKAFSGFTPSEFFEKNNVYFSEI
jgi:AraC-like DNA-binding protein